MKEKLDEVIEETVSSLEENHNMIESFQKSLREVKQEQVDNFLKYANKLQPIINFLKSKHCSFYSETFDCTSDRGPVIGRDDNKMYVWINTIVVEEYNFYTKESNRTNLQNFFIHHSYKDAVTSLFEVLKAQQYIIKVHQDAIDKEENEINEVKSMFK